MPNLYIHVMYFTNILWFVITSPIDKLKIWRKQILVETFGGAKQILSGQRSWALKHRVNIDWTFELLNYILALILTEG